MDMLIASPRRETCKLTRHLILLNIADQHFNKLPRGKQLKSESIESRKQISKSRCLPVAESPLSFESASDNNMTHDKNRSQYHQQFKYSVFWIRSPFMYTQKIINLWKREMDWCMKPAHLWSKLEVTMSNERQNYPTAAFKSVNLHWHEGVSSLYVLFANDELG